MYLDCSQATAVLTSKHFAQRQPWQRCAAATLRSMAAVSNWSWMSPPSFWGLATSARPWGQSSQPPRGPWLPRAEPCPPPLGLCWPALSPWYWKLCSESSPMLSVLKGTTHTVGIWDHSFSCIICFHFPAAGCYFSHLHTLLPCNLSHLLVCFPRWNYVVFDYLFLFPPPYYQSTLYHPHTLNVESVVKHSPLKKCRDDSTEIG